MSLMAIILWALNAFSPWRRFHERTRHLLDTVLRILEDQSFLDWVCTHPDHPDSIPLIERALDDLGSGIDLLVYQRARQIIGLNPGRYRRPRRSPPQSRRTRSFDELWGRIEASALRFADIERLAQRRAEKMKRLLEPSEITLDPLAHTAILAAVASCLPLLRSNWRGRRIASTAAAQPNDGGGSHVGTLGARAPPLPTQSPQPTAPCLSAHRLSPRICAQTAPARSKPQVAWTSPLDFALSAPPCL